MKIAFTGSRQLSGPDMRKIWHDLDDFICGQPAAEWHVGDAPGLDALISVAAVRYNKRLIRHDVTYRTKWGFAERSQRMVNALVPDSDSWLYGFPNKPCPPTCTPKTPFSGHGSGTWGTVAYARQQGVKIYLFPLGKFDFPHWLWERTPIQLSLF